MIPVAKQEVTKKLPREFTALAGKCCKTLSRGPLELLWRGYDQLLKDKPKSMDRTDERQVTQHLVTRINRSMSGFEPYSCIHKPNIEESQKTPKAQPPEPDIGFVLHADERLIWPIEAKIVKSPSDTEPYLAEIENNFVTRRYAPFANQGALLAYLLEGEPAAFKDNLAQMTKATLKEHPAFPKRPQWFSKHQCKFVEGLSPPKVKVKGSVVCHHLAMPV